MLQKYLQDTNNNDAFRILEDTEDNMNLVVTRTDEVMDAVVFAQQSRALPEGSKLGNTKVSTLRKFFLFPCGKAVLRLTNDMWRG